MPGPLHRVDILNWPGSFQVSNFPSVQPVSVTGTAQVTGTVALSGTPTVNVGNFPSAQTVSGTVAATQSGAWSVGITGTPTVTVGNFPASQPVTGTFWQATQPVSAASLPLPAGAATASGVAAVVTALGSPLQQGGTVSVGNLPAIQPVVQQPAAANGAITPKTATNVTAFIANGAPCNFFGATVVSNPSGASAYVLLLNRTTVPTSGANITQTEIVAVTGFAAGGIANLIPDQVPDRFTVGCVLVCSTSTTVYTPLTSNFPLFLKARVA
jgi:hypothetical protein